MAPVVVVKAADVGKQDAGETRGMKRSAALVGCSAKVSERSQGRVVHALMVPMWLVPGRCARWVRETTLPRSVSIAG